MQYGTDINPSAVTSSLNSSATALAISLREKLSRAKNVLLVGVGGGNDSISALLLPAQFERDFGFSPDTLQVAAMLPDVVSYSGMLPLTKNIYEILPSTTRSIGKKVLKEFPEPILATHRERFGLERIVGLSMAEGTEGLTTSLREFIEREKFDLVLACDVGGDFIATESNLNVLSPMMDAYALNAFRYLQNEIVNTEFLYCVFGLGTDGESTPEQLHEALDQVGSYHAGKFDLSAVKDVDDFYRKIVEHNRPSRTADFTLRTIHGEKLPPTLFRARFHTQPTHGEMRKYYGEFMHIFDDELAARYYLFDTLDGVRNPFELQCANGVEWFIGIQKIGAGLNHEMNGQSYSSIEDVLGVSSEGSHSIFFGTPSFKFSREQRKLILEDISNSIKHGVYDSALILRSDTQFISKDCELNELPVSDSLLLLTREKHPIGDWLHNALTNI